MKTNQAFINEYLAYDEVFECLEKTNNIVDSCISKYKNSKRQEELRSFFENVMDNDDTVIFEAKGILETIGNAIVELIGKIAGAVKSLGDTIFGTGKKMKTDVEIVNQMIAENPEIKDQVVDGLKDEWFTYKDIAQYEKDMTGLLIMLKQKKIDHKKFADKAKDAADKFNKSAKVITCTGSSIASLLGVLPKITKQAEESKKSVSGFSKLLSDFKKDYKDAYTDQELNSMQAAMHALTNAIGLTCGEAKEREGSVKGIGKILNSLANSKVGKLLKTDKASRDARHQKAKDDRDAERDAKKKKEQDKYYADKEAEMMQSKEHNERMKEIANRVNPPKSDADRDDEYYQKKLAEEKEKKRKKDIDDRVQKEVYGTK